MCKPVIYLILGASSKPIYFSLYFNDTCLHIIPLKLESHTQLPSKLVERCYREITTHTTTIVQRCRPNSTERKVSANFTTLTREISLYLITFLKPFLVTIGMY